MPCTVVKISVVNGEPVISVNAECDTLYEACDIAYGQPRNGTYAAIDGSNGEVWSMAELIAGGFSSLCTEHEHSYWKDWLNGNVSGVAVTEGEGRP